MSITDWPANERPREKLLQRGAGALSDAELLAIFIRTGVRGKTAVDLSRDLLTQFGSLRRLLAADIKAVCACTGLGQAKYSQLQAALEIGRRFLAERLTREGPLSSPASAQSYLSAALRDREREVFGCIFLDTRHHVLTYRELFEGTVDAATVHPREVVRTALQVNASAVIVAHNHPSGIAEPSGADEAITKRLSRALALVDITLLDHLVIGDGVCVSLAERGLL